MTSKSLLDLLAISLRTSVAVVPLIIAAAQAPAYAQTPPSKAEQLAAEAAANKTAAAAAGAEADDAAEAAERNAGLTGLGKSTESSKDIVVTGTSIRGVAPTGSNVITITREDIQATGATSVTELFSTIPQLSGIGIASNLTNVSGDSFNNIAQVSPGQVGASFGLGTNIVRSGLRQNVGDEQGTNTLILVDGQRQSNIGSQQLGANQNGVPAALLERVELNTDGASSTYGSDSIGGVINMVTRRRFDGIQVSGKFGYADDYSVWDTSLIAGHTWGKLSVFGSYAYGGNELLLQGDRPFIRFINWITGAQTGTSCSLANVGFATGSRLYPVNNTTGTISNTGFTTNSAAVQTAPLPAPNGTVIAQATNASNVCTNTSASTLAPANQNHNGMVSLAYDFSDAVKLTLRGRYAQNKTSGQDEVVAFNRGTGYIITPNNPWYRPSPTTESPNTNQTVFGTYGPVRGPETRGYISAAAKQWGAFTELSWNVDGNWRVLVTGNYDESRTNSFSQGVYNAAQINNALDAGTTNNAASACALATATYVTAGGNTAANAGNAAALAARTTARASCLNPYDITQTNPAILNAITNFEYRTRGSDRVINPKAVVDGSLFTIPGGRVKVAAGGEYREEKFANGFITGVPPQVVVPRDPATQKVWGVFGELNIPVVSSANAMPFIRELRLAISGRYDHYNIVGGTFNPKIGVTFKPTSWVSFRGNWSTNFRAPSAFNLLGMRKEATTLNVQAVTAGTTSTLLVNQGAPAPVAPQAQMLLIDGTCPCIKPQRSNQWSVGIDLTPAPGLRASVSYYFTQYKSNFGSPIQNFEQYEDLFIFQPAITQAALDAYLAKVGVFANITEAAARAIPLNTFWALIDRRTANLGKARVGGLDYSVRYSRPVGFGSIFASVSGTVNLMRKIEAVPGNGYSGTPADPRHRTSGQLGFVAGPLRSTLTVTHSDGFRVIRSLTSPQDRVADFNQATLFASYDFPGDEVITKGLQLSLTIQNLLNTAPPVRMAGNGVFGNTIGRVIQVGFQKKF